MKVNQRTTNIKRQAVYSVLFKMPAVLASFLAIPLVLHYLGTEQYGVWVTLSSVVAWSVFFDFGLGNGMRNKVAAARAEGNDHLARIYISTAYVATAFFSVVMMIGTSPLILFFDWQAVFNTHTLSNYELQAILFISMFFTLLIFTMSTVNSVLNACQKSSYLELNQMLISVVWLAVIYMLSSATHESMVLLSLFSGTTAVVCTGIVTATFFIRYPSLKPSLNSIDLRKIREIITLGGKFFIIQVAYLVIFTTDSMIITQVMGPEHVTSYSITYKLFSIITLINGIATANLWSAYTDAFAQRDFAWITKSLRTLNWSMLIVITAVSVLGLLANDIVAIWLRREIVLPTSLIFCMGLFVVVSCWSQIYAYFLNGIGKINLQVYASIFAALINIPVSIFFAKYLGMGSAGVILGTTASLSLFAVIGPLQTLQILRSSKMR